MQDPKQSSTETESKAEKITLNDEELALLDDATLADVAGGRNLMGVE